ncbi:MAG TPA: alanine--tRNA ligase [Puia sp.]|nr:alanine--tRNA ligase [Puia sp.]
MMTSSEIRSTYLNFFQSKGHLIVPSAPLIAKNDPTLMFNNSGMAQFKDYFLGNAKPPSKRIADTQRCLRVSGKHNDLEDVGFDTYHNTMFEMLGNWSFGDYFKEQALAWAWELLTEVYKISEDRIYVSVFGGDEKEKLGVDKEAFDIWKKILGSEDRIIMGSKKDNFWEMGDVGPCGPCSEIHVDVRDESDVLKVPGKDLVNKDHPQVVEVWNIVFMQFERKADRSLVGLPEKHVDTGMGFERLCMVLQGKKSSYDTDVFQGSIALLEEMSGKKYTKTTDPSTTAQNYTDVAMRVVADHIRAVAFAIADGQLPSNAKAGYVIRRILRRAIRYGYSYLNLHQPFMYKLVPLLAAQFKGVFPELDKQADFVVRVVEEEEKSFLNTLTGGLDRLERIFSEAGGGKEITGKQAFELSDTYGFPLDLTELIGREHGFTVDGAGFNKELALQKERSRKDAVKESSDWVELGAVEGVEFLGYDSDEATAQLMKYRIVNTKKGKEYHLVLDRTPFYAEMGGQAGDTGVFTFNGASVRINDTKKEAGLVIHIATDKELERVLSGLSEPVSVHAVIDKDRRTAVENNHTATHLLLGALRSVLGSHVVQRGSYLNDEFLRFDFSHFAKMSDEEIARVEDIVNEKIRQDIPLAAYQNMPYNEALKMGATATFGEKYGAFVRVIVFDPSFSIELCGGTHVSATGKIGLFKILSEGSVSAGVRRIEAVTAKKALDYVDGFIQQVRQIQELVKGQHVIKSIEGLLSERTELLKKVESMEHQQVEGLRARLLKEKKGDYVSAVVEAPSSNALKQLAMELRKEIGYVVLGTVIDGKPMIAVAVSDEAIKSYGLHAGQIVKAAASEIGGTGGGQPSYAMGGGNRPEGLKAAVESARSFIELKVG